MNDEEKAPRTDSTADPGSSPSSQAKVGRDESKRTGDSEGAKRTAKVLTTSADELSKESEVASAGGPAVTRAEEIMDRAGERVGQFLRSGERVGQFLRAGSQQVKQQRALLKDADEPTPVPPDDGEQAAAVARAEEIMDRAGERVGQLLRAGGYQVQRTTELAREAVEDFWAEAESIRRGNRPPSR